MTELRWHPLGKPVPSGWQIAQAKRVFSPSNHYQVLIQPIARKVGRSHLLDGMPLGWMSAQKLAEVMHRPACSTRRVLAHALKRGWVERRKVKCACCASSIFEYRRVK